MTDSFVPHWGRLLQLLLDRTIDGTLSWDQRRGYGRGTSFSVSFDDQSVILDEIRGTRVIRVENSEGQTVDSFTPIEEISFANEANSTAYDTLSELYEQARRSALDVEGELRRLEERLMQ